MFIALSIYGEMGVEDKSPRASSDVVWRIEAHGLIKNRQQCLIFLFRVENLVVFLSNFCVWAGKSIKRNMFFFFNFS